MRVVRLDLDAHRLDLHPYVTVVRGLDDGVRAQLVDALAGLASGRASVGGLVEAHGVFLDLGEDTLELLEVPTVDGEGFDVVVRPEQLPESVSPQAIARRELDRRRRELAKRVTRAEGEADRARLALTAGHEALAEVSGMGGSAESAPAQLHGPRAELERLTREREELERRVDEARLAHAGAQHELLVAEQRMSGARERRTEADRQLGEAAARLESARRSRDPFASAKLDMARDHLAALEGEHEEARAGGAVGAEAAEDNPLASIEELEHQRRHLEARLVALDTIDPYPVENALDLLTSSDDVELVPSPDALRVAEQWARNEVGLRTGATTDDAGGRVLATARQRLDAARELVFEAERAARSPDIDRGDIEALENAHEAVLVAQERATKRFGGDRGRRRLEDAQADEQAILDRLGFPTYAAFLMGTSILNVDAERERTLERARAELSSAEDAVAQLEDGVDAELARAALLARRRSLVEEARLILGRDPGDDIEWELRHHRVEMRGGNEGTARLRAALERAGIVLGEERVSQPLLVDLARVWLDEQRATVVHREVLERELALVDQALHDARAALAGEEKDEDEDEGEVAETLDPAAELDRARIAVRDLETLVARQAELDGEIRDRKAMLHEAGAEDQAAATELVDAEEAETSASRLEHEAAAELARLQAELEAASEAERELADAVVVLSGLLEHVRSPEDRGALERSVREAEAAVDAADAKVLALRGELDSLDRQFTELSNDPELHAAVVATAEVVDELEWYLLSRLANHRSVSYAGSVPFVVDRALDGIGGDGLRHVLDRLERMSSAVQVIILTDDDNIAWWADAIGRDRAMVLVPELAR